MADLAPSGKGLGCSHVSWSGAPPCSVSLAACPVPSPGAGRRGRPGPRGQLGWLFPHPWSEEPRSPAASFKTGGRQGCGSGTAGGRFWRGRCPRPWPRPPGPGAVVGVLPKPASPSSFLILLLLLLLLPALPPPASGLHPPCPPSSPPPSSPPSGPHPPCPPRPPSVASPRPVLVLPPPSSRLSSSALLVLPSSRPHPPRSSAPILSVLLVLPPPFFSSSRPPAPALPAPHKMAAAPPSCVRGGRPAAPRAWPEPSPLWPGRPGLGTGQRLGEAALEPGLPASQTEAAPREQQGEPRTRLESSVGVGPPASQPLSCPRSPRRRPGAGPALGSRWPAGLPGRTRAAPVLGRRGGLPGGGGSRRAPRRRAAPPGACVLHAGPWLPSASARALPAGTRPGQRRRLRPWGQPACRPAAARARARGADALPGPAPAVTAGPGGGPRSPPASASREASALACRTRGQGPQRAVSELPGGGSQNVRVKKQGLQFPSWRGG